MVWLGYVFAAFGGAMIGYVVCALMFASKEEEDLQWELSELDEEPLYPITIHKGNEDGN
jgi:hypothetical protein